MQDVAVIPAIAVVAVLSAETSESAGINPLLLAGVVGGLVVARFTLRPALHFVAATGIHELFTAAALALVVGAALAMHSVGLSMGLGAFIAGMMVADSEYRHQLEADVMPFKGLLLGLFFIAVGMATNLPSADRTAVSDRGADRGSHGREITRHIPACKGSGTRARRSGTDGACACPGR